jgi:hypothetical protein
MQSNGTQLFLCALLPAYLTVLGPILISFLPSRLSLPRKGWGEDSELYHVLTEPTKTRKKKCVHEVPYGSYPTFWPRLLELLSQVISIEPMIPCCPNLCYAYLFKDVRPPTYGDMV